MNKLLVAAAFLTMGGFVLTAADLPIVTVLDLETRVVSESEMKGIIALISSGLLKTGKFIVIDVAERDTLLKELEFSTSDCTDQTCQIEVGKLLSAEYIVVGSLNKIGSKLVLSLKMLETSTSRALSSADGIYDDLDALLADFGNLSNQIARIGQGTSTGRAVAKPQGQVPATRIAGVASIGAGVVTAGIGGYLIYNALVYFNGPVQTARAAYDSVAFGAPQSEFDTTYAAYLNEYSVYGKKMTVAALVAGAGGALGALGVVLVAIQVQPSGAGRGVALRAVPIVGVRGVYLCFTY